VYTVVVVNCTFSEIPNYDNNGGKLMLYAYYSTSPKRYEKIVALEGLTLIVLTNYLYIYIYIYIVRFCVNRSIEISVFCYNRGTGIIQRVKIQTSLSI
jgi:hypothetical protein